VFAGAVLAIPVAAHLRAFGWGLGFSLLVLVEIAVLAVNGWQCPLRGVAGRYTASRADGFDICIPPWLARNNKQVFGTLFALGEAYLLWRWLTR
jgi:hypothetical protein